MRGDSGVIPLSATGGQRLRGYEAQIACDHLFSRTGGLIFQEAVRVGEARFTETLSRPDEWFLLEVIAQDNHLVTKVNGKLAVDLVDGPRNFMKGHIGLQLLKNTVVQFRKIEIKEPFLPTVSSRQREGRAWNKMPEDTQTAWHAKTRYSSGPER